MPSQHPHHSSHPTAKPAPPPSTTALTPSLAARGQSPEALRLRSDADRVSSWKRWGPYLAARQWGTVREDYSADGSCWTYFPHDHARSRAYRWGEDGLLGICDRQNRLCLAACLWNGHDPILKERLFGLTGPEGNHGEDVKEEYFFLDSTPTHSYMSALYKYPHAEFPYGKLVSENRSRSTGDREFELADTGIFDENRYFDVVVEYAKANPEDLLVRITATNRGPDAAPLHLLPNIWFPNSWAWGRKPEWQTDDHGSRPRMHLRNGVLHIEHSSLGERLCFAASTDGQQPRWLFTENETNAQRLFGSPNASPFVKDGFHERIIQGRTGAVNPRLEGTKAAPWWHWNIPAGHSVEIRLRICPPPAMVDSASMLAGEFDEVFRTRRSEADQYYDELHAALSPEQRTVARQSCAGLLWSKQFFHYVVREWLEGDPTQPAPPAQRLAGRNADWDHVHCRDVISMPDTWEYPWFAAWDLAFQMIPMAPLDPRFAKDQLILFLREWYMHPSGQIPAYEFAFGDVNPPVHAWACWRVYKMTGPRGGRDREFLARAFQKLLLNFTWWVNRKDPHGRHVFSGGFLGLDNIGVFDRSRPLPTGGSLEQADGTAWMAFACGTMLSIALELASEDPVYDDMASKFFEHFIAITDAMNTLGGSGLWDEQDGFYYDQIRFTDETGSENAVPLRLRSMVGIIPLLAVEVLRQEVLDRLPAFKKRTEWFIQNRPDLSRHIAYLEHGAGAESKGRLLLAVPSRDRLERVLRYVLDENEFLSPFGIRSLSKRYESEPFQVQVRGEVYSVRYVPGESDTTFFGGNSNWRGPIWFPLNYLLLEALERYHYFYGDSLKVECPTGSGVWMNLREVAAEIRSRLIRLFMPDSTGSRPCHGGRQDCRLASKYATDPHWRNLVLFNEHFHADTGRGLGATHQTGWTALIEPMLRKAALRPVIESVLTPKGAQPSQPPKKHSTKSK